MAIEVKARLVSYHGSLGEVKLISNGIYGRTALSEMFGDDVHITESVFNVIVRTHGLQIRIGSACTVLIGSVDDVDNSKGFEITASAGSDFSYFEGDLKNLAIQIQPRVRLENGVRFEF